MPPLWFLCILFSQCVWAIGVYLDKYLVTSDDPNSTEDEVGTLVLVSAFFNGIVALVVLGVMYALYQSDAWSMVFGFGKVNIALAFMVGVFEILWLIPYFYALDYTDETAAPPLFQTIPIFGLLLGFFVFSDIPTQTQLVASLVVVAGALILNLEIAKESTAGKKIRSLFNWKAIGLMLLASFIVAFSAFIFKDSAEGGNYGSSAFWMAIGAFVAGWCTWFFVPSYRKQFNSFIREKNYKKLGMNAINETTDNLAIFSFYGAVVLGPATAVVQAGAAYQPILLLLIGVVLAFFGSSSHKHHLNVRNLLIKSIGICLIVGGSVFLVY